VSKEAQNMPEYVNCAGKKVAQLGCVTWDAHATWFLQKLKKSIYRIGWQKFGTFNPCHLA